MTDKFDYKEYIRSLGKELVLQFERAKLSTHTVAIGENKEIAIYKQLESVLPYGIAIGCGFVFVITGTVSKQCDIILYEKDFAIRCPINGDEKNCYYNVESVIAVGEIKSTITTKEYADCLTKFEQLTKLRRYKHPNNNDSMRKYFSSLSMVSVLDKNTNQLPRTNFDNIFKFVCCEKLSISFDQIIDSWTSRLTNAEQLFNVMFDVQGKYYCFATKNELAYSPYKANQLIEGDEQEYAFNRFIEMLTFFITEGTTVPLNISTYSNLPRRISYKDSAILNVENNH